MNTRPVWTTLASVSVTAVWVVAGLTRCAEAQNTPGTWPQRTPWGDPDLQGEWTSEGEFGVPFERPAEFGTRDFLTDEEYAQATRRRAATRRARSAAGRRACRQGRRAERADSALARIRHGLAAHIARDRSAERPAAAANTAGSSATGAAVRQPAARRAVRLLRGLRARRALHRPRRRFSGRDVPGRLQREFSHRPGVRVSSRSPTS